MSSGKWRPFCLGLNVLRDRMFLLLFMIIFKIYSQMIALSSYYLFSNCPLAYGPSKTLFFTIVDHNVWFDFYSSVRMISVHTSADHMLGYKGPAARVGVLIFAQCMIGLLAVTVIRDNANLTSVPQDINVAVTSLSLQYNDLIVIHNGSFPLYTRLKKLQLSRNPLEEIKSDTFDNNPELRTFICDHCSLYLFPVDFGPASTSLNKLELAFGIKDITAFSQMRFQRFTSLKVLGLFGVKATDMNLIQFPTSITNLGMSAMKLTIFPNLTFDRFPNLKFVRLEKNKFQEGSNFFGVTEVIEGIYVESSNLHCADGLDLLPKLAVLDIKDNELETIPDFLGLPNIRKLYINGNSRMNCDQRMCWRRLWDRMREPIEDSDDVICVEPPSLAGRAMSTVNPKFMHCINGKLIRNKWNIHNRDYLYICQGLNVWYIYTITILEVCFEPLASSSVINNLLKVKTVTFCNILRDVYTHTC